MERTTNRSRSRMVVIGVMVAAIALVVSTTAGASAPLESGVVDRKDVLNARISFGDGLVVLTGPSFAEGCFGLFEDDPALIVNPPNGQQLINLSYIDGVSVFDDLGFTDPFEWLQWMFGQYCPEVFAGGPGPEPLASGEGRITTSIRVDADGVMHGHGGVTANLTTPDGSQVHLNAQGRIGVFPDFINFSG